MDKDIIVRSQQELDSIPEDYNGRIYIEFGTPYNRAVVNRWFMYPVVARDNSSVVAKANSQVLDASPYNSIEVSGNARIVHNPTDIMSYIDHYDIESSADKAKLFKAVHNRNGLYVSDYDPSFEYKIGDVAAADFLDTDPSQECGKGIHVAYKEWCVDHGREWRDLAIIEVECEADGIIVPTYGSGKVRVAKVKVLREVPLEECGLLGKILARRRKED